MIKKTLAALGLAAGLTIASLSLAPGAAHADGGPPSGPGAEVGQNAYVQSGPNTMNLWTWNGSSWDAAGCFLINVM